MSPRGGKVPTGDMPRDAKPPSGGSTPDVTGGLETRDVVRAAVFQHLARLCDDYCDTDHYSEEAEAITDAALAALDLPALLAEARADAANNQEPT